MPFVAGISLIKRETGSPVMVHVLPFSTDSEGPTPSTGTTFTQPILDASDFTSTFAAIAAALPEETVQTTLAVPTPMDEKAHKPIVRAAHKVRVFRDIWFVDNIQVCRRQLDLDPATPTRNELFIEITPSLAFARLEYTDVDEGIRSADYLKEVCVSLPESGSSVGADLISALLDPILVQLRTSPSPCGSNVKNIIITGGNDALLTPLSESIKTSFVGGNIIFFSSDYAKHAAKYTAMRYQEFVNRGPMLCTMHDVPIRVGIEKADGFVVTALRRHTTLPYETSLLLTTSIDNQTTATVRIVYGVSPVSKDNNTIAELVLKDMKPRPKGETIIKVSFIVEEFSHTTIIAEESREDGTAATGHGGARASIELESVLGDDVLWDDVEDLLQISASFSGNPAAAEAENNWAGERACGDLPR